MKKTLDDELRLVNQTGEFGVEDGEQVMLTRGSTADSDQARASAT